MTGEREFGMSNKEYRMLKCAGTSLLVLRSVVFLFPSTFVVRHSLFVLLAAAAAADIPSRLAAEEIADGNRLFALKVLPLFKEKCLACHGEKPDELKGEFDMRTRAALLKGGESEEPAIVPGKPEQSPLFKAIRWEELEMPPKENDRLTAAQIELVRHWIAAGAPWPDEAAQRKYREEEWSIPVTADGVLVKTSGGLSDNWTYRRYKPEDLWAWRPVKKLTSDDLRVLIEEGKTDAPTPSPLKNQQSSIVNRQSDSPIDLIIRAKLATTGFEPAAHADPRTLIRRATFDLIGLPPTPDEIAAFERAWKKDSQAAWSELIDRLLASPHYGERWAQHWFDATRYADTGGMANDYERSNMWRYRDYVIRSFNDDLPYDRFVIEQLAGDELADQAALERLGGNAGKLAQVRKSGEYSEDEARMIVATGFLRMGPWDNAMVSDAEARQIYLDDLVNAVGQTFLSTTLRCVKCHDHKFDPIPTRDYYRIYAALAGTQMAERPLRFTSDENREGFADGKKFVQRMLDFATREKQKLVDKREMAARAWYAEHNLPYKDENARRNDPDEMKPSRNVGMNHVEEGQLKVREQDEWIWTRALERYEPMVQSVYSGPDEKAAWNAARKLRMPPNIRADAKLVSHIYMGGSLEAKGDVVQPGVLSAIGPLALPPRSPLYDGLPSPSTHQSNGTNGPGSQSSSPSTSRESNHADGLGSPSYNPSHDPFLLPDSIQGRRLALAKWIAHPQNPLTTRSIVNRVWQHHFGKPLAANPVNFGAKGGKPTHPELLDWLAADFVEHGWKLKRLHKLIMMSAAYQQAAQHPRGDELRDKDPNNDLLAYFPTRRLTAEEMRDAMLAVTGELNPALGGLPVMPEINMEVALQPRMIQFSLAPSYQPSRTPQERNRRSIYAYRVRGQADPFLEVFNQPNPNDSCEVRDSAAVSPQAFTLFNSDLMTDRSIAFALRLQKETKAPAEQIARAFQLAFGRAPSVAERDRLGKYLDKARSDHARVKPDPVRYPTKITQSLVEEFSGKSFEYEEILPVFENYVPDKKAADVSSDVRALADLCLLLFNSHEFVYLH